MVANNIQETNSIARDMKYEALYWALGFEETDKDIFVKHYVGFDSTIDMNGQTVAFDNRIIINSSESLYLTTHKSFVVLECIDRLLSLGYSPSEIIVELDNEYDVYCNNLYIRCFEWGHMEEDQTTINKESFVSINYSSRLVSGVIEREYTAKDHAGSYTKGVFENNKSEGLGLHNDKTIEDANFVIEGTTVKKYIGNAAKVVIPEGITDLSTCLFWDNQTIEEVALPESLENISGDTFYNCNNLRTITIPKNVQRMGNNPFAGCPELILKNESPYFRFENGCLYNRDYSRLIYCSIKGSTESYAVDGRTKIIGKHTFYLCHRLKRIVLPESLIKLENNPFSGCENLDVENHSFRYHIVDKVIYDSDMSSVIGCLNSIDTDELKLLPVKRICRNSFWNCKGIRKIILPKTLKKIGYNPFVGCSNIEFVSECEEYVVSNGALFNKDKSTLICYPAKYAIGDVTIPDETITLERGAFSGASKMTSISLHNVSIISKTCFTNCDSLKSVYCSDLVCYIGEWAFAHCKNLEYVSVYKDCFIDKNVSMNSPVRIDIRQDRTNYVIESDNQHTLKSMLKGYEGKIDSILIDPPYNSHIDYIGYKDSSFDDGYSMFMRERIEMSYKLLSNNGFLVINIDKGEVDNLKNICKEYFGKLVRVHKWEKLHPFFDVNRNVHPGKKKVKYEYIIICRKTKVAKLKELHQPYIEGDQILEYTSKVPSVFRCFGTNSSAKDEIQALFGRRDYFSTPKPLKLMKELVRATTDNDSIVLDFFAGSGTVGHAVADLNKEDGGDRCYILVSNKESNICRNVTIKRAGITDKDVRFLC